MSAQLKALLVEANESDALLLAQELRRGGFEALYKRVDDSNDMKIALQESKWDVVLGVCKTPDSDVLSTLQLLRKHDTDLPFVVVSKEGGEEKAEALIKAGAQEFLMLSNLHGLGPAIHRALVEADNKRLYRITEEELRTSEELFRTLAKVSKVGILLLSRTCEARFLNDSGCEILGLSVDEVYGTDWMTALHPDDRESFVSGLMSAIEGDISYESEHRTLHRDGTVAWVLSLATGLKDSYGKTASYLVTLTDITQLKIQQEKLSRLIRALSTLSRCNELIIRAESEQQLLNDVCETISTIGGYCLTYTGPGEQAERIVPPLPDDALLSIGRTSKLRVTVCNDCGCERWNGNGSPHLKNNETAANQQCMSLIFRLSPNASDDSNGELRLYDRNAAAITESEVVIFEELAADLSFGIQNMRLREERNEAQHDSIDYQVKLRQSLEEGLKALAATLEQRDPYTAGHQERVADLARCIGLEMGLQEEKVHAIYLAGVVHDIGKVHIPAEILSKPSKLTYIEFELIKTHSKAGYDILKGISFPWPLADIVWQHHERLNGSGYPRGLTDSEILLEAKIVAVADVVDAMASHRPYRAGLGIDAALEEIVRERGTLYDPAVVDACVKLFHEKRFQFSRDNTIE